MWENGEIWCQTCTDIGCVNFQSPHPKHPHPHPETTTSFLHSSSCNLVLLLWSLSTKCICHTAKANWVLWNQTRQNSSGETLTLKREITGASVCAGLCGPHVGNLSRHNIVCAAKPIVVIILAGCAQECCWSQKESVSKATEWRNAWASSREAVEASLLREKQGEASQRTMMSTCR